MKRPSFDSNGYPTAGTLRTIRHWRTGDPQGLMDYCREAWKYADTCWRQEGRIIRISTSGWSGNESIIESLIDNMMFWLVYWVSSRRGGHYEFELPEGKEPRDADTD